jgi:hypothetical protein
LWWAGPVAQLHFGAPLTLNWHYLHHIVNNPG